MKSLLMRPAVAGLISGLLIGTSYPPFPAWSLFFCLSPLWLFSLHENRWKKVFFAGFVAQFFLSLIGFNWVSHTASEFGHLPKSISYLILVLFCCTGSLHFPIAASLAVVIKNRLALSRKQTLLTLVILTGAAEWFYPMIFPWNLGYPLLFNKLKMAQLADLIGFSLLSLVVMGFNALFTLSLDHFPERGWSRPLLVFLIGVFGLEMAGGFWANRLPSPDKKLNVLLVQPNIGNYDKFFAERGAQFQEPVIAKDLEITQAGLFKFPQTDVVIWPETALPIPLDPQFLSMPQQSRVLDFFKSTQKHFIVGGYSQDPGIRGRDYNAVFAIDQDGQVIARYQKHILLAFGEYFPGAQWFPFLKKLIPAISDFGRGEGPKIFTLAGIQFAPMICYEGLDTKYVSSYASGRPQIFVNVTNDSWFGEDFEPQQHLIMTAARSIEYRVPLIRATNTGISAIVDETGQFMARSPQNIEWAEGFEVPYQSNPSPTPFSFLAPWLSAIYGALILGLFVWIWFYRNV
ncbi:MAG: apolipoprotein N-acyltransferase [Oligoflexia bacterium]|nr:apolipoprotein N-acyltransferase [Oligoflexia bacterium]